MDNVFIEREELRRAIGLGPEKTIVSIVVAGDDIIISCDDCEVVSAETEEDKISLIRNNIKLKKEISFLYKGESRTLLPLSWRRADSISGYDLDKEEYRTFFLKDMGEVRGVK